MKVFLQPSYFFVRESSIELGAHWFSYSGCLANPHRPPVSTSQCWNYRHATAPGFSFGYWGPKLKFSFLHDKHFTN